VDVPGGYCKVSNRLLDSKDLSPRAKAVYVAMRRQTYDDVCHCPHGRIAATCGWTSSKPVQRALNQELIPAGWVTLLKKGNGAWAPAYRVHLIPVKTKVVAGDH
jgi:hypothetical protein